MQKRIIGFRLMNCSHNSGDIVKRIVSVIEDFRIQVRTTSITVDNTTANPRAILILKGLISSYTGEILLHQRCAWYIINFIVKIRT